MKNQFSLAAMSFLLIISSSCLKDASIDPILSNKINSDDMSKSQRLLTAKVYAPNVFIHLDDLRGQEMRMNYDVYDNRFITQITSDPLEISRFLSMSQIGSTAWRLDVIGSSEYYLVNQRYSTRDTFSCDITDPISNNTVNIDIESDGSDLNAIPINWNDGDVTNTEEAWGWVVGLVISLGTGLVLHHCADVVGTGVTGLMQVDFLKLTGVPWIAFQTRNKNH